MKHNFLEDGYFLYTSNFQAILKDLSFLTAPDFVKFGTVSWDVKNMKEQEFITHLDFKLCTLFSLNLPKMCKAPHVCYLDGQLSVKIIIIFRSDGGEKDYVDENMKAGLLDSGEREFFPLRFIRLKSVISGK